MLYKDVIYNVLKLDDHKLHIDLRGNSIVRALVSPYHV